MKKNKFLKKGFLISWITLLLLGLGATFAPTTVQADTKPAFKYYRYYNWVNYPAVPILTVKIDGQEKQMYALKNLSSDKDGEVIVQDSPLVDGHTASSKTITFVHSGAKYYLTTDLYYTKNNPNDLVKNEETVEKIQDVYLFPNHGNSYRLVGFTDSGEKFDIKNRALAGDSYWYSDKYKIYDGAKYYRVATNEWVKRDLEANYW